MRVKDLIPFAIATAAAIVAGTVLLILINAALLKVPVASPLKATHKGERSFLTADASDYKAITERNLFRAKLQIEVPKPKTEKEIEEETLTNIVRTMALRGVMTGVQKKDNYAVIDRGGTKGVGTYEIGDVIERGLAVTEIKKDGVLIQKSDFLVRLRLFSGGFERLPGVLSAGVQTSLQKKDEGKDAKGARAKAKPDLDREIRKEGKALLISKPLADQIKSDNSLLFSSVAVKAETDARGQPTGYKIVAVDKGSVAQKMGILPDDTIQEVNGYKLNNAEDFRKAYDTLKNETRFEVRVLRKGRVETLRYEIR
jgi:type II secretory pathway component PulC